MKHNKRRKAAIVVYSELYEFLNLGREPGEYFQCFYCGDAADAVDHQPPISRISDYRALTLERELYVTVPCCGQCNSLLRDSLTVDLLEREQLAKIKLASRYARFLRTKPWTEDEMDEAELSGSLRGYVSGHQRQKDRIEARLGFKEGVAAYMVWLLKRHDL